MVERYVVNRDVSSKPSFTSSASYMVDDKGVVVESERSVMAGR